MAGGTDKNWNTQDGGDFGNVSLHVKRSEAVEEATSSCQVMCRSRPGQCLSPPMPVLSQRALPIARAGVNLGESGLSTAESSVAGR